jgi:hypothetical protein
MVKAVAQMHWCLEHSSKFYFSHDAAMRRSMKLYAFECMVVFALANVLACLVLPARCAAADASSARELPSGKAAAQDQAAIPDGMARLYVFRPIRSYGGHIEDYITLNGVRVHRLAAGSGFYCDVHPGDYVIGVASHQSYPAKVSVAAGQSRYVCVMLHRSGAVAPRAGALTSDQAFDVHVLESGYGAERAHEYRLTRANCQP